MIARKCKFWEKKTKTIKSYKIIAETRVRFLRSSEETESSRCLRVHRHRGGLTRQKVVGVDTESKSRTLCAGGFTARELNWTELTCKNSTHLHDAFIGYDSRRLASAKLGRVVLSSEFRTQHIPKRLFALEFANVSPVQFTCSAQSFIWNGHYDTIRYDKSCYFNVRSKADVSLNLPHGKEEGKKLRKRICWDVSVDIPSWESAIVASCIIFYLNTLTFYLSIL